MLLRHHLALWDVIRACDIQGSSDASIRNAEPVDILQILNNAPVERVLCNGTLAGKLYRQWLQPVTGLQAVVMPSTSPANASWSLQHLIECWQKQLCS